MWYIYYYYNDKETHKYIYYRGCRNVSTVMIAFTLNLDHTHAFWSRVTV